MRWWYLHCAGFTSFSAVSPFEDDSILLWSHYGNSHSGAVLEFETDDFMEGIFGEPDKAQKAAKTRLVPGAFYKVRYCQNRLKFHNDKYEDGREALKLLCRKARSWAYEKELRVFVFSKERSSFHPVNEKLYNRFGQNYISTKPFSLWDNLSVDVRFPKKSLKAIYFGCGNPKDRISSAKRKEFYKSLKKYKCRVKSVHIDRARYGFHWEGPGWMGPEGI